MEITTMTIAMRGAACGSDWYPMDARVRVPAPTHLPVQGTAVRTGSTVFAGGVRLVPAYRTTDVNSSASERPPV